jgi:hypothetical protein
VQFPEPLRINHLVQGSQYVLAINHALFHR